MLKPGDKVKRKNGTAFSNGKDIVTIEKIENSYGNGACAWLLETKTWVSPKSLEHATKLPSEIEKIKHDVKRLLNKNLKEMEKLEDERKKLNCVLATLEDINE